MKINDHVKRSPFITGSIIKLPYELGSWVYIVSKKNLIVYKCKILSYENCSITEKGFKYEFIRVRNQFGETDAVFPEDFKKNHMMYSDRQAYRKKEEAYAKLEELKGGIRVKNEK